MATKMMVHTWINGEEVSSPSSLRKQVGRRVQQWQIVVGRGEQRFNLVFGG